MCRAGASAIINKGINITRRKQTSLMARCVAALLSRRCFPVQQRPSRMKICNFRGRRQILQMCRGTAWRILRQSDPILPSRSCNASAQIRQVVGEPAVVTGRVILCLRRINTDQRPAEGILWSPAHAITRDRQRLHHPCVNARSVALIRTCQPIADHAQR